MIFPAEQQGKSPGRISISVHFMKRSSLCSAGRQFQQEETFLQILWKVCWHLTAPLISLVVAGFWQWGRMNIIAIRAWINIHLKNMHTNQDLLQQGSFMELVYKKHGSFRKLWNWIMFKWILIWNRRGRKKMQNILFSDYVNDLYQERWSCFCFWLPKQPYKL